MNNDRFEQIINRQFDRCKELLVTKGKEYTPDKDILEVFNKAATLSGEGGRKAALFSFMLKHLVSISDMCHSNETYSMDRWNEKITDAMNYLLLLKAMIEEDEIFRNDPMWQLTGLTTEELTTEIKLDQIFTKDGVFEASILTKDCKNCDSAIWSLDANKETDIPHCFKKVVDGCNGYARTPYWKEVNKEEVSNSAYLAQCLTLKEYDFSKYECDLDFPYCVLGGPEKCPTCKHWIEKEPTPREKITREDDLEDDLK